MQRHFDFPATQPSSPEYGAKRPATIEDMLAAMDRLRGQAIISLGQAIYNLGLLERETLNALWREDPDLLRSKSASLVHRLLLTPEDLQHALARTAGIVEVDVTNFEIAKASRDILDLQVMRTHEVIALGEARGLLCVASWCPTSEDLHGLLCALTGRSVLLVWAERDAIAARIARIDPHTLMPAPELLVKAASAQAKHAVNAEGIMNLKPGPVSDEQPNIEDLMQQAVHETSTSQPLDEVPELCESSSIVRMVKRLIQDAQDMQASDIHIETNPGEEFTRIRLRRDGDLELYQKLPPQLRAPLVSRIKIMARLDIAEHRRPQDGKINFADFGGTDLELRVAVMPTHDGMEDVVLRLLASCKPIALAHLGMQARDTETIRRMSSRTFGLILAAGPTGSGKTTTLHSLLEEINTDEKKIWTAEDPIEITHPGLRQVQVNPKIGLTFASAMRGFLRADPDVIMIGEIRDEETAKIAVEASLTGHLVLSTLHTNSASESVVRLLDLGMDALNFADSLVGVVAQRLVRALCGHCSQERPLLPEQWEELLHEYVYGSPLNEAQAASRLLAAAGVQTPSDIRVKTAHGCAQCGGKGYKGRMGIYEILENSASIRLLIQRNSHPSKIFEEAVSGGTRSLRHDALEKWVQRLIDLRQARTAYL